MQVIRVLLAAWAWCVLPGHVWAAATDAPSRVTSLAPASVSKALGGSSASEAAKPAVLSATGASEPRVATLPPGKGVHGAGKTPPGSLRSPPDSEEGKTRQDMALFRRSHTLALCKNRFEMNAGLVDFRRKYARAMCGGEEGLTIRASVYASSWAGQEASEPRVEKSWKFTSKPDEAKLQACLQEQAQKQKVQLDEAHAKRAACEANAWDTYRRTLKH